MLNLKGRVALCAISMSAASLALLAACGGFEGEAASTGEDAAVKAEADGATTDTGVTSIDAGENDGSVDAGAIPFTCDGFTYLCTDFESADAGAWPSPFTTYYGPMGTGEVQSDSANAFSPSHSLHLHANGSKSDVHVVTSEYMVLKTRISFRAKLPTLATKTRIVTVHMPTNSGMNYVDVHVDITSKGELILAYASSLVGSPVESPSAESVVHEKEWARIVLEVNGAGDPSDGRPTVRLTSPATVVYKALGPLLNPDNKTSVRFAASLQENPDNAARDVYFDDIRIEPF